MSQCPLGFTGTPPPGHPKVAGMASAPAATTATAEADEKPAWNPWLLLVLDALFLLAAVYVARNGVPRTVSRPVLAALGKLNPAQAKADPKSE